MAIKNGTNHLTDHFLDDYITFEATQADCDKSIDCLAITTEDEGFERQLSKYTSTAQEMEAVGLIINTVDKVIRVPPDKLSDIFSLLEEFTNKTVCTKRQLLSLIGKLNFISQAVRAGRTFLRRLICLSKKVKHFHYKVKINSEARGDISWWVKALSHHSGITMFPVPWVPENMCLLMLQMLQEGLSTMTIGSVYPFLGDSSWLYNIPIGFKDLFLVVKSVVTFGYFFP